MKIEEIGQGATFYTATEMFINECQVTEAREKALKVKVRTFNREHPDKTPQFMGFAWVPKKALNPTDEGPGIYTFADWFTPEFWKPQPQARNYRIK